MTHRDTAQVEQCLAEALRDRAEALEAVEESRKRLEDMNRDIGRLPDYDLTKAQQETLDVLLSVRSRQADKLSRELSWWVSCEKYIATLMRSLEDSEGEGEGKGDDDR